MEDVLQPGILDAKRDGRAPCRALEPEWLSTSDQQKETLMSIDCAAESNMCKEFDVVSYPALRYFDGHGNMKPYRGPRRSQPITSFVKRATRPAISILNNKKALAAFPKIDDTVFIAQVNSADGYVNALFESAADTYQDRASFGAVKTSGKTAVVCYNNRDEERAMLSDFTDIAAIPKFVKGCMDPLIGEFTRVTESKYLQPGKSLVYYLADTPQERDAYVESTRPVAKKYREFLNFVTVDANEYGDLTVPLGLPDGTFPALAVQNPVYGQVFPYPWDAKITPQAVEAFVIDISQGKVQPWDGIRLAVPIAQHDEL